MTQRGPLIDPSNTLNPLAPIQVGRTVSDPSNTLNPLAPIQGPAPPAEGGMGSLSDPTAPTWEQIQGQIEEADRKQRELEENRGKLETVFTQGLRGALDVGLQSGALVGAGLETAGSALGLASLETFGRELGESASGNAAMEAVAFMFGGGGQEGLDQYRKLQVALDEQERAWPTLSTVSRLAGSATAAIATGGLAAGAMRAGASRAAIIGAEAAIGAYEGAAAGAQASYEQAAPLTDVLSSMVTWGVLGGALGTAAGAWTTRFRPEGAAERGVLGKAADWLGEKADMDALKHIGVSKSDMKAMVGRKPLDVAKRDIRQQAEDVWNYRMKTGDKAGETIFEDPQHPLRGARELEEYPDLLNRAKDEVSAELGTMRREIDGIVQEDMDIARRKAELAQTPSGPKPLEDWGQELKRAGVQLSEDIDDPEVLAVAARKTFGDATPTAEEFLDAFSVPGYKTTLEMPQASSLGIEVRFRLNDAKTGAYAGSGTRRFRRAGIRNDGPLTAVHDDLYLQQGFQGKGIGTALLDKAEQLYPKWGVESIRIPRAAEVGRYAWARRGFTPETEDLVGLQKSWKEYLAGKDPMAAIDAGGETLDQIARHPLGKDFLTSNAAQPYAATMKLEARPVVSRMTQGGADAATIVDKVGLGSKDVQYLREGMRNAAGHPGAFKGATLEQVKAIARGEAPTMDSKKLFSHTAPEGKPFEPVQVEVYKEAGKADEIVLKDGRHRLVSAQNAGADEILANVKQYEMVNGKWQQTSEVTRPVSMNPKAAEPLPETVPDAGALLGKIEDEVLQPLRKFDTPSNRREARQILGELRPLRQRVEAGEPAMSFADLEAFRQQLKAKVYTDPKVPQVAGPVAESKLKLQKVERMIDDYLDSKATAAMKKAGKSPEDYFRAQRLYKNFSKLSKASTNAWTASMGNNRMGLRQTILGSVAASGALSGNPASVLGALGMMMGSRYMLKHGRGMAAVWSHRAARALTSQMRGNMEGILASSKLSKVGSATPALRRQIPRAFAITTQEDYQKHLDKLDRFLVAPDQTVLSRSMEGIPGMPETISDTVAVGAMQRLQTLQAELPRPKHDIRGKKFESLSSQDLRLGKAMIEATVDPMSVFTDFSRGYVDYDKVLFAYKQWPGLKALAQAAAADMFARAAEAGDTLPESMITQVDYLVDAGGSIQETIDSGFSHRVDQIQAEEEKSQQHAARQAQGLGLPASQATFTQRIANHG